MGKLAHDQRGVVRGHSDYRIAGDLIHLREDGGCHKQSRLIHVVVECLMRLMASFLQRLDGLRPRKVLLVVKFTMRKRIFT
jgi:hypothetical protein